MRYQLAQASHTAFAEAKAKQDFGVFLHIMKPLVAQYQRLYRRPLLIRMLGLLGSIASSVIADKSRPAK